MSDEKKPVVNTVDRYVKQSRTLHLTSYSSCEIAAGCVGVVYRWVNPLSDFLAVIYGGSEEAAIKMVLDGEAITSRWPKITVGEHVLAVEVPVKTATPGLVLSIERREAHSEPLTEPDRKWALRTLHAGGWKVSDEHPGGWSLTDFDDRAWPEAVVSKHTPTKWNLADAIRRGAVYLTHPRPVALGSTLRFRKRFVYEP